MNQSGPFVGVNVFACDRILNEAVMREGAGSVTERASILRSVDLSFALHFLERLARVSEGIDT
jgi:hypothetical protein